MTSLCSAPITGWGWVLDLDREVQELLVLSGESTRITRLTEQTYKFFGR